MLTQYLDILMEVASECKYNYSQLLIRLIKNVNNMKFLNGYLDYQDNLFLKPMDWCYRNIASMFTFDALYTSLIIISFYIILVFY